MTQLDLFSDLTTNSGQSSKAATNAPPDDSLDLTTICGQSSGTSPNTGQLVEATGISQGSSLDLTGLTGQVPKPSAIGDASFQARRRMLADRGEPLFYANWDNAVFIHYEADPAALQRCVPFALDLFDGRAFVSIVAFTLREMRPRIGGKFSELLFKPVATHHFFNVRTYVCHHDEVAIYFMAEWLQNRLSLAVGPITFGLPYRYGKLRYANVPNRAEFHGCVSARQGAFEYRAVAPDGLRVCEPNSPAEFLLERYTAFTGARRRKRFFRVWHQPWQQSEIEIDILADDLLASTGDWWPTAQLHSAHYSPGVTVWMGWPHFVET